MIRVNLNSTAGADASPHPNPRAGKSWIEVTCMHSSSDVNCMAWMALTVDWFLFDVSLCAGREYVCPAIEAVEVGHHRGNRSASIDTDGDHCGDPSISSKLKDSEELTRSRPHQPRRVWVDQQSSSLPVSATGSTGTVRYALSSVHCCASACM